MSCIPSNKLNYLLQSVDVATVATVVSYREAESGSLGSSFFVGILLFMHLFLLPAAVETQFLALALAIHRCTRKRRSVVSFNVWQMCSPRTGEYLSEKRSGFRAMQTTRVNSIACAR